MHRQKYAKDPSQVHSISSLQVGHFPIEATYSCWPLSRQYNKLQAKRKCSSFFARWARSSPASRAKCSTRSPLGPGGHRGQDRPRRGHGQRLLEDVDRAPPGGEGAAQDGGLLQDAGHQSKIGFFSLIKQMLFGPELLIQIQAKLRKAKEK